MNFSEEGIIATVLNENTDSSYCATGSSAENRSREGQNNLQGLW